MPMFVGSQGFISLPSFMLVGAAISEIRESNWKKEEEEKKNLKMVSHACNLTIFSPELPFDHIYAQTLLEV